MVEDNLLEEQLNTSQAPSENHCDNCILWDELDLLTERLNQTLDINQKLVIELDEYKKSEEKSKKRLLESDKKADELLKTALYKYNVELKQIKLLVDKIKQVYGEELSQQKMAITDLLTDFLKDFDKENHLYDAKEIANKLSESLDVKHDTEDEIDEDFEFDLDAAINPKEDLDLKSLLLDLGVTGSN